jgi:uncharacterized Rmd1/YagE family protein
MSLELSASTLEIESHHLGRRIRLEDAARSFVDRIVDKAKSDLCLRLGEGWAYLFSFGSVVFVGVDQPKRAVFLQDVAAFVDGQCEPLVDDFLLQVDPEEKDRVMFERITLQEVTLQKLRLVSLVLAQSTTLEHFERLVEQLLDRAAAYTDAIVGGGGWRGKTQDMVAFLGVGLNTRRQIVSNLSLLDAPDIVWEDPTLDQIYHEHRANFELTSRYRTLEHKLQIIHESVEVLVDMANNRLAHNLELVVVILIAVEVVMAFIGRGH